MRLSIAVTILAHSLPVASKTENANPVLVIDNKRQNDNHQNLLIKENSSAQSALETNFLRRNKKTPTNDRFNNKRGTLVKTITPKEECDPATDEPDLGVLACGTGRHCMASDHSGLGGFCVDKPLMEMDRSLEANSWPYNGFLYSNETSPFTFCQPENAYYAAMFFYDCSRWDPETETGVVSRESSFMPVYDDGEGYCEFEEMFARDDEDNEFNGHCFRYYSSYESNSTATTTSLCFGLSESLSNLLPGTNCTMVVEGTTCNSCYFTPEPAETCSENQFMISTQRFIFDCENAGLGSNNYACIEDVPGCHDILNVCNKAIFG